jgi:hypothetical protein
MVTNCKLNLHSLIWSVSKIQTEQRWDKMGWNPYLCSWLQQICCAKLTYWLVVVVRQFRNFSTILWWVQVNFQWEDGEVGYTELDFLIVLAHWNNSPRVDISLQSDTLFWFRTNAVMLRLSINWKSITKTCFYFLVQYTRKCINSTHLSHKPIQLCVIYSKWKKIKY